MNKLLALFFLIIFPKLHAAELTFLIIKSPGISWTSPRALAKSTVDGANQSYSLGHVSIMLSCGGVDEFTGIANRYANETRNAVLKDGNGLGVLFRLFEGSLESGKYTLSNFERMASVGRGRFLTFNISQTTCERLVDYKKQYDSLQATRRARGGKIYYGFPALARYGEGAGCSGYAMSYLELAGIKENWMLSAWSRTLRVPKSDVGYPMRADHVGIRYMLYSSSQSWSSATGSHFPLFLWDPDLMYKNVKSMIESGEHSVVNRFGTQGVVLDRSEVPTPTESIFWGDVVEAPTDPRAIYRDIDELERRWNLSRGR